MNFSSPNREQLVTSLVSSIALAPLLAAFFAGPARAQVGVGAQPPVQTVSDTVRQEDDVLIGTVVNVVGRPMDQVEVYIAGTDRTTRTNASGVWHIRNPPPGPRVVVARQLGYVPYVREVVVGRRSTDTLALILRRYPNTLSPVEVRARTSASTVGADIVAERLSQIRVGSGRLFTRDEILRMRPYSIAELLFGIPGIRVTRGQTEIIATSTRAGVGIQNVEGQACQLQFYLDNTPIDNEGLASLDPTMFRSVEVYPQTLILTGLPMRPDKCGAIVINSVRR